MVQELERLRKEYEALISRKNEKCNKNNGVYVRYKYPVLTAEHAPLIWRYDFDEKTNPYMEERIGINATISLSLQWPRVIARWTDFVFGTILF